MTVPSSFDREQPHAEMVEPTYTAVIDSRRRSMQESNHPKRTYFPYPDDAPLIASNSLPFTLRDRHDLTRLPILA